MSQRAKISRKPPRRGRRMRRSAATCISPRRDRLVVPDLGPEQDDSMLQARFVVAKRPAFRTLTRHPLFPAIHGRLIARDSTHRIAA
jgi:hypothetical protein